MFKNLRLDEALLIKFMLRQVFHPYGFRSILFELLVFRLVFELVRLQKLLQLRSEAFMENFLISDVELLFIFEFLAFAIVVVVGELDCQILLERITKILQIPGLVEAPHNFFVEQNLIHLFYVEPTSHELITAEGYGNLSL